MKVNDILDSSQKDVVGKIKSVECKDEKLKRVKPSTYYPRGC